MHTTLTLLKKNRACKGRYRHLLKQLGGAKKYGYNTPIQFPDLLEMNGLDDTLWALRAVSKEQEPERDLIARLFACDCAEHVLPIYENKYPEDKRVCLCIEAIRKFAYGQITAQELTAAWEAAREARFAAVALADAAAADAAAWAARAADAAAWVAARAAADAARAAARAAADAARAAAWALTDAARAAVAAARAARAADAAAAVAARDAEEEWQKAALLKLLVTRKETT